MNSFRLSLLCILCVALGAPLGDSKTPICARDPDATVDIPISLAVGRTIQTPEFAVKHKTYLIEIQAQKRPSSDELACRMGWQNLPSDNYCKLEPLIEADWTVLDGDRVVAHGHTEGKNNDFEADACYLGRFIGEFKGESKHKYVLEVKFTKDGTALDANHPHLVVLLNNGWAF